MKIRIGTRGSALAIKQAEIVETRLKELFQDIECQIVKITTSGDKIQNKNLYDIGGKALFLKEIEEALKEKTIDIAVHSMKDVPGRLEDDFTIAAVLEREDPRDVFVSNKYTNLSSMPNSSILGTSSMRRKILITKMRPDIKIVNFRGNVITRLKKLDEGIVDATILASAGLKRLGFENRMTSILDTKIMLPAAGQGTIAIEVLKNNNEVIEIVKKVNHLETWVAMEAERSFIEYLDASCDTPVAAHAIIKNGKIYADYMLGSRDGLKIFYHSASGDIKEAKKIGYLAAEKAINHMGTAPSYDRR